MKLSIKDMLRVSMFAALMVVGAFLRIPFPFLPVTLQGFFSGFSGILLGARLGLISQLIYIMMGLMGLPVFAGGGGITYVLNPSFGYLIGFALCAFIIGLVRDKLKHDSLKNTLISLYCGLLAMYLTGLIYSYAISVLYLGKTNAALVSFPIVPFFIKDIILFAVAGIVVNSTSVLIKKHLEK